MLPGYNIESTIAGNDYGVSGGTSVAAAHVAGVAALALSANRGLSALELRNALVSSAQTKIAGSDSIGAVNALRTLAIVRPGAVSASTNVAPAPSSTAAEVENDADFNNDGSVDFRDFLLLAQNFGADQADHDEGDANGDGMVLFSDFVLLAQTFGERVDSRRLRFASATAAVSVSEAPVPSQSEIAAQESIGAATVTPEPEVAVPAEPPATSESEAIRDSAEAQEVESATDAALAEVATEEIVEWTAGSILATFLTSYR